MLEVVEEQLIENPTKADPVDVEALKRCCITPPVDLTILSQAIFFSSPSVLASRLNDYDFGLSS